MLAVFVGQADSNKILGESVAFWIQTGVIFAAACVAAAAIVFSLLSERRRGTVELTLHQESNTALVEAQEFVIATRKAGTDFVTFLSDPRSPQCLKILKVLNNYEFIAAAIHENALSETMYRKVWHSRFMADWEALCAYVVEKRRKDNQPSFCVEYETLVHEWKKRK